MLATLYAQIYRMLLWKSALFLFLFMQAGGIIVNIISFYFFDISASSVANQKPDVAFITGILLSGLFAPIVETLLFQCFPILLISVHLKKKLWIAIFLSGLIFGLIHSQSVGYMVAAMISGWILALGYAIYYKKYGGKIAFLSIAGIHALHNIVVLSLLFFVK